METELLEHGGWGWCRWID